MSKPYACQVLEGRAAEIRREADAQLMAGNVYGYKIMMRDARRLDAKAEQIDRARLFAEYGHPTSVG